MLHRNISETLTGPKFAHEMASPTFKTTATMGSVPRLSIVKGPQRDFRYRLVHRIFETNVETCATKTAIIYGNNVTTYGELNANANKQAKYLLHLIREKRVTANQDGDFIIAVCMPPSDQLVSTLLAVMKAGASYLPLDAAFPQNRIDHILNEAKPMLVIHDGKSGLNFNGTVAVTFDTVNISGRYMNGDNLTAEESLQSNGIDQLGIVLYTSGSTGIPKGVRLPHSIIMNRLEWQWERFPYSPTERFGVFKTALTFVDSVSEIWGPLLNDMAILVISKDVTKNPERLVEMLESYKIERLVLVPTLLRSMLMFLSLKNEQSLLRSLRIWVCSGEPLAHSLVDEFFKHFNSNEQVLCNFYGSTEVMGDVTYYVCENRSQLKMLEKIPIGYPVNNTVIYLLDDDYRPVKAGTVGELFVSGLNLAAGYVNKRDADRFVENPLAIDPKYDRLYKTGDFARIEDGVIYYEGRTDSQIKIRGHRVDLSEVEKNILQLDCIEKAVVLCYHAGELDQTLLAFVTMSEGRNLSSMAIENQLKNNLTEYMIPQVVIIENVPLLVNGKVDRQSLLKMYENTNNNDDSEIIVDFDFTGIEAHKMNAAKDLFETIGQVIGRSARATLSKESNFYALGGNSLNSIYTVTLLREKGYFIGISDFIGAENLDQILTKICESRSAVFNSLDDINYVAVPLKMSHKDDAIRIITTSFYEKADLEQWLKPDILFTDYGDILEAIWPTLIEKDLSFVIVDRNTSKTVGVALNFDARDEPEVVVNSKLIIIFEFLEHIEGPIRDNYLPLGVNKILHSFMMGTCPELNSQENIKVINFMEDEVLKLAQRKRFAGILTTNTNPLTQQLGSNVYGYKTMLDFQVNSYLHSDNTKPFQKAPDSQRAIVHWKDISKM